MKLRLIYLFLIGLLFCKAFSYTASSISVNDASYSFTQSFSHHSAVCFSTSHSEGVLSQPSLFIEDTDDDDYCYGKKKQSCCNDYAIYPNTKGIVSFFSAFKNPPSTGKTPVYTFPAKYIFIRSIRV